MEEKKREKNTIIWRTGVFMVMVKGTSKKETGERRMKMGPNVVVPNAGQKKREKKKESQMRS